MSLEQAIAANTAALEALTAAMSKAGTTVATTTPAAGGKGKDRPAAYTAKHTVEEMQTVMNELKEKVGKEKAIELRNTVGKVAKLSEVTDPKVIDELYEAAKKALTEAEEAM